MVPSYQRYAVKRRAPYQRFLKIRHLAGQALARERFAGRRFVPGYEPWGMREGFPYWMLFIPGYWVREFEGRYQITDHGRGFCRGQYRSPR